MTAARDERVQRGARALLLRTQRALLDALGERVGTRVVYLKAAWADPVLYGGKGARTGVDIDILVDPERFETFARALEAAGFERVLFPSHRATNDAQKEWLFSGRGRYVDVDLHRDLVERPFFDLEPRGCLARAVHYEGTDGPILSLSPPDQVLFTAAHYANHCFDLDGRHLEDTRRLLELFAVDWTLVRREAREGHLDVPLALIARALRALGAAVPVDESWLGPWGRLRLRWAERFVSTRRGVRRRCRRRRESARLDLVALLPCLSGSPGALPRFLLEYAALRVADARRR